MTYLSLKIVEYDVSLVLALLRMSSTSKKSSDASSVQLSCLYSPETVMSFFGKLNTTKQEPELEQLSLSQSQKQKQKYGFTNSIFSFFGRTASTNESSKYDMLPVTDEDVKSPDGEGIDVERLSDIAEVCFFSTLFLSFFLFFFSSFFLLFFFFFFSPL